MAAAHFPLNALLAAALVAASVAMAADDALYPSVVSLPDVGAHDLRVITPRLLEVRVVQGQNGGEEPLREDLLSAPDLQPDDFEVLAAGKKAGIERVGMRRMPVYADYHKRDYRLILQVFLQTAKPLPAGAEVEVRERRGRLWPQHETLSAGFSADRISPAIHVGRYGFAPDAPKFAFVSMDLGTLGELDLPAEGEARLIDSTGREVWSGPLKLQTDKAWSWHQKVWRVDFSDFRREGVYRLEVPGLGRSPEIRIHDAAPAVAPRLLALGLYNQRSGDDKGVPWTRFGHNASHVRPAEVPDGSDRFRASNRYLGRMAEKNSEGQKAPVLTSFAQSLYPILRQGTIDVSGGHYDAGDYSKYVINSAQLIHSLVFAVDHFPGVKSIDNLGLPESGDGVPDALQIAMREARFLLKMQDEDGGFFFLVYPRDRPYELDVLPEEGDPQIVFPKNTSATAACTGALAQLSASPELRRVDPGLAASCRDAALRGYGFLRGALKRHGFEGSYQAISHYGNYDAHRDELCFAAAALFVATGERQYEDDLRAWWPDPLDGRDKKWGWFPLYEAYGSAARVYGFAEDPGFLPSGTANAEYLAKMRQALRSAADTWLSLSDSDAYGLPFSRSSKRQKRVGWFWAMDSALDLAAAWLIDESPDFRRRVNEALALWAAYEAGGNPVDRTFISGSGPVWRRQLVNRITLNDDRKIGVPGIPIGNAVSTPHNLKPYQIDGANGLRRMFIPSLDTFAFYDRSGTDAYNVREEWNIATGARLLAGHLFLMGRSPEADRKWQPEPARIVGLPAHIRAGEIFEARLDLHGGLDASQATIVWEIPGQEPQVGQSFKGRVDAPGAHRLEAEALWPDGRRVSAVEKFAAEPAAH